MFLRLSRQHPPFGFQVWHECPGPLGRCRRNLLATDSPAPAVAPAEGSSSPAKGRAALTTTVVAAAAAESTKNTTITGATTNLLATAMVSPRSLSSRRLGGVGASWNVNELLQCASCVLLHANPAVVQRNQYYIEIDG
jgi:hypothetical protein